MNSSGDDDNGNNLKNESDFDYSKLARFSLKRISNIKEDEYLFLIISIQDVRQGASLSGEVFMAQQSLDTQQIQILD